MSTIQDFRKKYYKLIAPLDLELLFSFVLKKPREFVLAHPEQKIPATHASQLDTLIKRRIKGEPVAYLIGQKEFYGLNFKVNKNTLVPRPETELLMELASEEVRKHLRKRLRTINIIDIGTGSGNIIVSLACSLKNEARDRFNFYGIDISKKALLISRQNAKMHKVDGRIKFLHGNLLDPILKNKKYFLHHTRYIILANLPYLSSEIYASSPKDVRLYEPKTALYSPQNGLNHYIKLLKQINACSMSNVACYMEISPEQKPLLQKMIGKMLPFSRTTFHKDLAQKWRVCKIEL
jgi:release factor glutamine methyltransferase